ncbi:hypothetical protein DUI87_03198 [Hirundo rustica rustica]|uniref:Integrase zinc-binding domain-containing protein n=1 Tax=Hirundo rustica rustica TaxID=333673 RepID=A0A3M0LKL6_HIRRU|nr:hypothetical protein DUI87_03198 [Hirundo rustica rustica]
MRLVIRGEPTYRWARDRGVDLTMDNISQVIHNCETCAAIKQAKRVKPLWYGGRWFEVQGVHKDGSCEKLLEASHHVQQSQWLMALKMGMLLAKTGTMREVGFLSGLGGSLVVLLMREKFLHFY